MKRIIFNMLLLLIIITCPWWASVLFGLFSLYYLKSFTEVILFGLVMDIYYGSFSPTFDIWDYKFTFLFFIFLLSSFYIKKRLRF